MSAADKAIGLFGGTFDPVHIGHVAVTQSYLDSGFIDELWIILTPDPPHKTGQTLSPYALRKEMLKRSFQHFDRVIVSDVENDLPKPSYTIQTLQYMTSHFNNYRFYLCMGEDSLINFEKWYEWEKILNYCEVLVADRPNSQVEKLDRRIISQTHFIDHDPVEVSSTELRKSITNGENVGHLIPDGAYDIILKHNLYRD